MGSVVVRHGWRGMYQLLVSPDGGVGVQGPTIPHERNPRRVSHAQV